MGRLLRSLLKMPAAHIVRDGRNGEVDGGLLDLLGVVRKPRGDVILNALEMLGLRYRIIRREARPDHEVEAAKDQLFCGSGHRYNPLRIAATGESRATRCQ